MVVPGLVWAGAEEPLPLLQTGEGISAAVYGHGAILEARVVEKDSNAAVVVRTATGETAVDLGYGLNNGTYYTVEDLRLVDVVGDRNPELWIEMEEYRAPCGCDDGPTFSYSHVTICRVTQRGVVCADPVTVSTHDNGVDPWEISGELKVSRAGVARVKVVSFSNVSRATRARWSRPVRLFRSL